MFKKLQTIALLIVLSGATVLLMLPGDALAINKPDLIVDSITPEANGSGFPVITIKNQGNAVASGKIKISLVFLNSARSTLPADPYFERDINLAPGNSFSFTAKNFSAEQKTYYRRTRYIKVFVDLPSRIEESNENNNFKEADRPLPDLAITNVGFDSERRPTFTVINQGTARPQPANYDKSIGIFAGWHDKEAGLSKPLDKKRWDLPDLMPGQSVTKTWNKPPPKTKYFRAEVNIDLTPFSGFEVDELNYGNNGWFKTIPLPDLVLGIPTFNADKRPSVTVTNQGAFISSQLIGDGISFSWLNKNKKTLPTSFSITLGQLSPGDGTTKTAINLPPPTARWLRIKADPKNKMLETQENNNSTNDVRLPFPELVVYGSYNSVNGQIEGRVANEGDLAINSFVIQYEWLNASGDTLGNPQTFTLTDTNDTDAADDNNDNQVGPGESVGFGVSPNPNATSVRITVDPANQITEWDESASNNVKVVPLIDLSAADQPIIKKTKKGLKPRF